MSGSSDMPEFSVIVCTRNRQAALGGCLASIVSAAAYAAPRAVELIVVDNGSTDETSAVAAAFAATAPIPVRLIHEARAGLSFARNAGMAEARGDYFVFTDDDCRLSADYFSDLARHCASDDAPVIRGGRVGLGDPQDAPVTIRTETVSEWFWEARPPGGFIQGCNMVIPRRVADKVGGFDVRLGAGSLLRAAEDADYIVRAHACGVGVQYVPDMQVLHFHGRRGASAVQMIFRNYNIGNGALYAKHLTRAPWLLKHFYWCLRGGLKELAGGAKFDVECNLSHWSVLGQNIRGMAGFALAKLSAGRVRNQTSATTIPQISE